MNVVQEPFNKDADPVMAAADHREALRQRLVDIAERTISNRGLAALRARDLANEAGCALGAIYNVFEHIDELILRVGARTLTMLDTALASVGDDTRYRSPKAAEAALVRLSLAYLDFAVAHTFRWRALFEHRMPEQRRLPEWFVEQQQLLFARLETPLGILLPRLERSARRILARTLFSAVHGIVALGLEEKLVSLPMEELREQLTAAVRAITAGRSRLYEAHKL